jgi:hypothetical protein
MQFALSARMGNLRVSSKAPVAQVRFASFLLSDFYFLVNLLSN